MNGSIRFIVRQLAQGFLDAMLLNAEARDRVLRVRVCSELQMKGTRLIKIKGFVPICVHILRDMRVCSILMHMGITKNDVRLFVCRQVGS